MSKFKIGTCFQTINISDFVAILKKLNKDINNDMSQSFDDSEAQEFDSFFIAQIVGKKENLKFRKQ